MLSRPPPISSAPIAPSSSSRARTAFRDFRNKHGHELSSQPTDYHPVHFSVALRTGLDRRAPQQPQGRHHHAAGSSGTPSAARPGELPRHPDEQRSRGSLATSATARVEESGIFREGLYARLSRGVGTLARKLALPVLRFS